MRRFTQNAETCWHGEEQLSHLFWKPKIGRIHLELYFVHLAHASYRPTVTGLRERRKKVDVICPKMRTQSASESHLLYLAVFSPRISWPQVSVWPDCNFQLDLGLRPRPA